MSSVLSLPFYELGKGVAMALPPRYAEVVERFAVGLRNPLISAAACMLVYALAAELGFGTSVAVLLALVFGVGTIVWPYSKHAFSEPVTGFWLLLSVFAASRAVRTAKAPVRWSVVSSVALGLAIGTKLTTAVAAPALLVYLLAAGCGSRRLRAKRSIPFGLILLLPALGYLVLNAIRFGSPLDTGYWLPAYFWHPVGIAGLLLSPSKSLFLYVPMAVLGVLGIAWLSRRLPWDAGLFFWLVASHVLLYGGWVIWWHGDAAWGPRYLEPIVPFVVLPVGAVLAWTHGFAQRFFRASFGVLFGCGVLVNLGGVLVDQRVSFVDLSNASGGVAGPTDEQRWDPAMSPVLIHWNEFGKRVSTFVRSWSEPVSLVSGTYGKEVLVPEDAQSDLFPRWTSGTARFELRNHGQPARLSLAYLDNRPSSLSPALVQVYVDGAPLPEGAVTRTQSEVPLPNGGLPWIVEAKLDSAVLGHDSATIEVRSPIWNPARDTKTSADVRDLGVLIWAMRFTSNGQDLAISESALSPMPVTDLQPWSYALLTWFYTPPHLADVWLWYLSLSDLPHWLLLLALVPAAGLLWSGSRLWRQRRPLAISFQQTHGKTNLTADG